MVYIHPAHSFPLCSMAPLSCHVADGWRAVRADHLRARGVRNFREPWEDEEITKKPFVGWRFLCYDRRTWLKNLLVKEAPIMESDDQHGRVDLSNDGCNFTADLISLGNDNFHLRLVILELDWFVIDDNGCVKHVNQWVTDRSIGKKKTEKRRKERVIGWDIKLDRKDRINLFLRWGKSCRRLWRRVLIGSLSTEGVSACSCSLILWRERRGGE